MYMMMSPPQSRSAPDSNDATPAGEDAGTNSELRKVFLEFARFGTRSQTKHMDIYRFMKMCRECGLLLRQQDVSSIDLIFYKVCPATTTTSTTSYATNVAHARAWQGHDACGWRSQLPGGSCSHARY